MPSKASKRSIQWDFSDLGHKNNHKIGFSHLNSRFFSRGLIDFSICKFTSCWILDSSVDCLVIQLCFSCVLSFLRLWLTVENACQTVLRCFLILLLTVECAAMLLHHHRIHGFVQFWCKWLLFQFYLAFLWAHLRLYFPQCIVCCSCLNRNGWHICSAFKVDFDTIMRRCPREIDL